MRLAVLAIALATLVPTAGAMLGDEVDARLRGGGDALAVCQFTLLVNTVVVASVEDSLGLVAQPAGALPAGAFPRAKASCAMDARNVTLRVRSDAPDMGGLVLGAPPRAGNMATADVVGPDHAGAVCQGLVLVNTAIVGGGALGLPPGPVRAPVPFVAQAERATCALALSAFDVKVVREAG